MSSTEVHNTSPGAGVGTVDMHLEVDIIPVSDVDRSKQFYQRLGWRLDADVARWTACGSSSSRRRQTQHQGVLDLRPRAGVSSRHGRTG